MKAEVIIKKSGSLFYLRVWPTDNIEGIWEQVIAILFGWASPIELEEYK